MKTKTELLLEADLLLAEVLTKRQEYEKLNSDLERQLNANPCLHLAVRIATLVGRIEGIMWAIGCFQFNRHPHYQSRTRGRLLDFHD